MRRGRAARRGGAGGETDRGAPYRVAFQLLGWAADHFAEIDGGQIRSTGRGAEQLTPRQACNLALTCLTDGMDPEQRDEFMKELYEQDARSDAKDQLREHLKAQGIEWDGEV